MNILDRAREMFDGKKVLILGLGLLGGGVGDVKFFCNMGAMVRVTDKKSAAELQSSLEALKDYPVTYVLDEQREEDIEWANVILRNPSVPYHHPLLDYARKLGKQIEMRSSLFAAISGVPIVGISGTRGKTTTTMMIYELLTCCLPDKHIFLGGNIAHRSDLELMLDIHNPDSSVMVMELSSWQLQGFRDRKLSPHVAVLTNLYPDHLNTYPNLESYYLDKKVIADYQTEHDYVVLNELQPEFHTWAPSFRSQIVWFKNDTFDLAIQGTHNNMNASAALQAALIMGIGEDQARGVLRQFSGVPYRQQVVANKHQVLYVNDTTATTPTAAMAALEVFPHSIMICGGNSKNLPTQAWVQSLNASAKKVILLPGTGTAEIKQQINPEILVKEVGSMQEAVTTAALMAQPTDSVVLSPGFTSFGLFKNEFDRGDQFNECVKNLP